MDPNEQAEFRESLAREIRGWARDGRHRESPWWGAIERIPDYFDALIRLSKAGALPGHDRRVGAGSAARCDRRWTW